MRKRKVLVPLLCLLLALLALPALAQDETGSKSWDLEGKMLYNIEAHRSTVILTESEEEAKVLLAGVCDTYGNSAVGMNGAFRMEQVEVLEGEAAVFEVETMDGFAALARFQAPKPGVTVCKLIYESEELRVPLYTVMTIEVLAAGEGALNYTYEATVHDARTGVPYWVEAGTVEPEGAAVAGFWMEDCEIWENPELGWLNFDPEDGSFEFMVTKAGEYEATVLVELTENTPLEIPHTIRVTGPDAPGELPEFWLRVNGDTEIRRLYNEGEDKLWLSSLELDNPWGREEDAFEWQVEQTGGSEIEAEMVQHEDRPYMADLVLKGALEPGDYAFRVTLRDRTRAEADAVQLTLTVDGETVPVEIETFRYRKIWHQDELTLKAGSTLSFGRPILTFRQKKAKRPADTCFGLWMEEDPGEDDQGKPWHERMIVEDRANGAHKFLALKEGVYTLHAWVNMYGGSRGREMTFQVTVEPKGIRAEALQLSHQGTHEEPFLLPLGSRLKLKATLQPKNVTNKKLLWTSTNPDRISVSAKGVVKALDLGAREEIWVYTTDGSELSECIVVEVVAPTPAKVTMKKSLSMKVGDVKTLKVKIRPANLPDWMLNPVWMSDNSSVAEVNRHTGEIQAHAKGKAVIYAYAVDEKGQPMEKIFAKCTVKVK